MVSASEASSTFGYRTPQNRNGASFFRPGKGEITINNRAFEHYFVSESARAYVRQPLLATETAEKFDVLILAKGGGVTGQAGAARLGIARALTEFNAELRGKLKRPAS